LFFGGATNEAATYWVGSADGEAETPVCCGTGGPLAGNRDGDDETTEGEKEEEEEEDEDGVPGLALAYGVSLSRMTLEPDFVATSKAVYKRMQMCSVV
jgi:hypothetical protein